MMTSYLNKTQALTINAHCFNYLAINYIVTNTRFNMLNAAINK